MTNRSPTPTPVKGITGNQDGDLEEERVNFLNENKSLLVDYLKHYNY